jgi:RNA polymerase sigma-70 factor (ECF subfamily)
VNTSDQQIIGEIYVRYGHLVFGLALNLLKNKENSEDLTMLLFEKLGKLLKKHSISYFKSWLYQVARNECLSYLRKNQQTREVAFEDFHTPIIENDDISNIPTDCFEHHLDLAMRELKEEQHKALDLFYLKKMTYMEISNQTSWEIKSVKSYIQNAKRNLKKLLEERCHEK